MKAILLQQRGREGVAYTSCDTPVLSQGEALVRMEAASLNRVDVYMRESGAGITHDLPQIMGVDGIGRIEKISGPSSLKVGQRVILYPYRFCGTCEFCTQGDQPLCVNAKIFGEHCDGTFATYIAAPTQSLLPIPDHCDGAQAASIGVAYLTAWRMVFTKAEASAGKTALIVGAGGGVACASVQLAKLAGCHVIATTTGADKIDKTLKAGADHVIDYKKENVVERVLALSDGKGVDFAVDNVGEATWGSTLRALKRGGKVVTCGATTGSHPSADLQRLFIRQLSILGSTMGSLQEFDRLVRVFTSGQLQPVIDSVYPLSKASEAFDRLEDPQRFGKVVLTMTDH
ncbi:zinc-binding dehydrogenase [Terasakiella pusilla]|uniref:zinc-binding dehydrogenase n=1 Tax=Terasakiella pusilla TaxID=64973 RepID=UPI003AA7DC61